MPEKVFIYALCEPGTRTIRYIGKTSDPKRRLRDHFRTSSKKKTPLGDWLRSLSGVKPNLVLLSEVPEEEGAAEEVRFIAAARTSLEIVLVNSNDGGAGPICHTPESIVKMSVERSPEWRAAISAGKKGIKFSSEHRANMSASHTPARRAATSAAMKGQHEGKNNPMFGKKHSLEALEKCCDASRGENNPMFGRTQSPEACAKISAKLKASWALRKANVLP